MGRYKDREWYQKLSFELISKYGDIPPPWIYAPNFHPYSMGWRMGSGETHLMVLGEWLDQQDLTFDEKLVYLKKYPSTPRWYGWIIQFLWGFKIQNFEEEDFTKYLQQLADLGFQKTNDFFQDLDRQDLE